MWLIENLQTGNRMDIEFPTREEAEYRRNAMGSVLSKMYRLVHESDNPFVDKILTEGLEKGDMHRILLPRISIDEYVPADPQTDNVVIAFYIKGVPEAVIPFKNFCEKCNGVMDVDYGDSDTVLNTSVVYVEMDRENLNMRDIDDLLVQVSMIASMEKEDFTMTFPHTNQKFPYNPALLQRYFTSRNRRKNKLAQKKAEKKAQAELDQELQRGHGSMQQQQAAQESAMVDALVGKFLEAE